MFKRADIIIDRKVRGLCVRPYRNHPRGCPNVGREGCPPGAPHIKRVLDLGRPVWVVWTRFDLAAHVEKMRVRHLMWTEYQLRNCLYWQGAARSKLRRELTRVLAKLEPKHGELHTVWCPEAMGVDVTHTMLGIGVRLEWPPVRYTRQVVLVGHKHT